MLKKARSCVRIVNKQLEIGNGLAVAVKLTCKGSDRHPVHAAKVNVGCKLYRLAGKVGLGDALCGAVCNVCKADEIGSAGKRIDGFRFRIPAIVGGHICERRSRNQNESEQ